MQAVQPLLERRDMPGLISLLKSRWDATQILSLLHGNNEDARKVAALALGLVGGSCCLDALTEQLRDPDPVVNEMAEHAIWSIWFRRGCQEANHQLCRGAKALDRGDYPHAIKHFDQALQLSPEFAEPHHQRAVAEYLLERYEDSIRDCQRAVELVPSHFGAWATMGHCQAHLNRLPEAVACYEKALSINPHMTQVKEAIEELKLKIITDV